MSFYTRQMLDDALKARHELKLGRGVAQVRDQNGEMLSYSKADIASLDAYIIEIKHALGISIHGAGSGAGPGRPWYS